MNLSRRSLLKTGALAGAAGVLPVFELAAGAQRRGSRDLRTHRCRLRLTALKPLGDRVKPITVEEYKGRIAHAQQLMTDSKPEFAALYLAGGTSLYYFTGIRWGLSERAAGCVIPQSGDPLLFARDLKKAATAS